MSRGSRRTGPRVGGIKLVPRVLWAQKGGNTPEQNEDASAFDVAVGRVALADGAGSCYGSGRWARMLAGAFVAAPPAPTPEGFERWLEPLAERWTAETFSRTLDWNEEAKAEEGAASTLLGLQFETARRPLDRMDVGTWRAIALGDTCLFLIRDGVLSISFPVQNSGGFPLVPPLLSTRIAAGRKGLESLRVQEGICRAGDLFLVVTDAMARWFLSEAEMGGEPWNRLVDLREDAFPDLVVGLREDSLLVNDDVTVVAIEVERVPGETVEGHPGAEIRTAPAGVEDVMA